MAGTDMPSLCRDCDVHVSETVETCPACGSYRIVSHPELETLSIAHIDCDAFFAAIEKRDHPELKDKPVIVGGGKRGVVATCCYLARLNGVRSAMPMFKALKACPEAVVVKPRREAYSAASRQIREKFEALTPKVQMLSVDEGFLDLSGTTRLSGAFPAMSLSKLAREVERDVGITISIGLSENKFLAKTASEMDKPRGFAVIAKSEAVGFLADKPVGYLHGVGKQLAKKLERDGYRLVGDLQVSESRELIRRYGETGLWLHQRAQGIDNRPVRTDGVRKSVSAERTFNDDIAAYDLLEDRLWQVCEETALRAKRHNIEGSTVILKLKSKDFRTITRSITLATPTNLANALFRVTKPLLKKETLGGKAYRLIGVGLSHLQDARWDARDLVDPSVEKRAKAERASDAARSKFGDASVVTGRAIRLAAQKRPKT
ncbi:MAG: DNA polymerase IV [Hyphomonadaceae bacterium]|nr:DNA polymerase IV [Hyphomonadaceae bacterium]